MTLIGGHGAGHRSAIMQNSPARLATTISPPPEEWDDDDDFDLSSISGNALELPRSDLGSDDQNSSPGKQDPTKEAFVIRKEEEGDWDAELADDEDQGDTLKVSSLTDSTLAQLAALSREKGKSNSNHLGLLSLDGLPGSVIRLGTYNLVPLRLDAEGCGDWDEGLEVPDDFPPLRSLPENSSFASDLDFESPSVGSTSDATTASESLPSQPHDAITAPCTQVKSRRERIRYSSTSSISSLSASSSKLDGKEGTKSSGVQGDIFSEEAKIDQREEEDDFDLPSEVTKLALSPTVGRRTSLSKASKWGNGPAAKVKTETMIWGSAPRYTMATVSSRARQTDKPKTPTSSSSLSHCPITTRVMKGPKRARAYDGKELDSIDDLVVDQDRVERTTTLRASNGTMPIKKSAAAIPPSATSVNNSGHSSTPLIDAPQSVRGKSRPFKRRQPMLIKNLGNSNTAPRVEGDMKWNPALQRWEGNEEEGRNFDNAVKGSGRPALITLLSKGSANAASSAAARLDRPAAAHQSIPPMSPISAPSITATTTLASTPLPTLAVGSRIVGDMMFDPIRLRWTNKNADEEEEDPFAALDDESDEEEEEDSVHETNGSSSGSRRVKGQSSSASINLRAEAAIGTNTSGWTEAEINKLLARPSRKPVPPEALSHLIPSTVWQQCMEAKARHDNEMMNYIPKKEHLLPHGKRGGVANNVTPARDRSSYLYTIQTLARKATSE
ncbi:hypothetical protein CBS101457_006243 [Exobasidium rhododendri]|nr:hypothetical protein CBS101457_006243 [Exobasidium rhododendri]